MKPKHQRLVLVVLALVALIGANTWLLLSVRDSGPDVGEGSSKFASPVRFGPALL